MEKSGRRRRPAVRRSLRRRRRASRISPLRLRSEPALSEVEGEATPPRPEAGAPVEMTGWVQGPEWAQVRQGRPRRCPFPPYPRFAEESSEEGEEQVSVTGRRHGPPRHADFCSYNVPAAAVKKYFPRAMSRFERIERARRPKFKLIHCLPAKGCGRNVPGTGAGLPLRQAQGRPLRQAQGTYLRAATARAMRRSVPAAGLRGCDRP